MRLGSRTIVFALTAAALTFGLARTAAAQTTATDQCRFEYRRADNMWGSVEDSKKSLGNESITLQPGQKRGFVTDWRYEKTRNDGQTYYGSHLRHGTNRGSRVLKLTVKAAAWSTGTTYLDPGVSRNFNVDLLEVACP